ncbi:ATP-binding protein [Vreelandella massiliensis]|uniref:ATP-binding protein n=1 Tax=Vreelandella massiliensis TaxID=1816686 RepID=UPI00096A4D5C|nr:MoxR family ATPase [Halomonas massiliensis]
MYATPDQAMTLLSHQAQQLAHTPALAEQLPPVMLWGAPGVGKSAIVRKVAEEQGIGFIDIRLAQREPVDLRGLPVPDNERGVVDWLLAGEWPRDPNSRGILLFDELTAADRSLQVAAYELILDRRLGDLYRLPPGWLVVAAGNRLEDRAVAQTFSSALANRFCHLNLTPDLDNWTRWARSEGLHPEVIAFLRFRPECFFSMEGAVEQGWPSPRSWARVAQSLRQADSLPADVQALIVHGLVGEGAGTEFLAFRDWALKLPDIPAMLAGKVPIQIPERADQRYAFCAGLAHALWKNIEADELETPSTQQRLARFFAISRGLTADFATLALLDALQGPDDVTTQARTLALLGHPDFSAWSEQHGEVFQQHLSAQMGLSFAAEMPTDQADASSNA